MRTDTPYRGAKATTFDRPSLRMKLPAAAPRESAGGATADDVTDVTRVKDGGLWSRVPAPTGLRITCASGSLWITQSGGGGDAIVRRGTSFVTTARGKVVVQAMGDAAFTFDDRA